jgi:hypothetical protein
LPHFFRAISIPSIMRESDRILLSDWATWCPIHSQTVPLLLEPLLQVRAMPPTPNTMAVRRASGKLVLLMKGWCKRPSPSLLCGSSVGGGGHAAQGEHNCFEDGRAGSWPFSRPSCLPWRHGAHSQQRL